MSADANVALMKRALMAFGKSDEDAYAGCVADGWLEHRWNRGPTDLEHMRILIRENRKAFNDLHTEIHAIVADEESVACHLTISGIHTGTFFGVEATGKRVVINEMLFNTVEDGRLRETWAMTDSVRIMDQIKVA